MKTIKDSGPLLFLARTRESDPACPYGKIRLTFVRYSTVEYDADDKDFNRGSFKVHDANCAEAKELARLVKE